MDVKKNADDKNKKIIPPKQLIITLETNIPGYDKIRYSPSMTLKNINQKNVLFNPLIKLNQKTINNISSENRIKEFYDENLFRSLTNLINPDDKTNNLVKATKAGYVDNNIQLTLSNILKENTPLYIGGKSYVMLQPKWDKSNWKIDISPNIKKEDELKNAQKQLDQIPKDILIGNNFDGKIPKQRAENGEPSKQEEPSNITQLNTLDASLNETEQNIGTLVQINNNQDISSNQPPPSMYTNQQQLLLPSTEPTEQPETKYTNQPPLLPPSETSNLPEVINEKQPLLLESSETGNEQQMTPTPVIYDNLREKMNEEFNKIKTSNYSNEFLIDYFSGKYYQLIKDIFATFDANYQNEIVQWYKTMTNVNMGENINTNLEYNIYKKSCELMNVIQSPGDGDCFFYAVSTGINLYNYENNNNKITYKNYGKTEIFTALSVREIVANYMLSLGDDEIENMLSISQANVEDLNDAFEYKINTLGYPPSKDVYLEILNYVYVVNDNFLVYKPKSVPKNKNEYLHPFRILKKDEIDAYIKDKNYWANDIAIKALCHGLNIYVIPVEKNGFANTYFLRSYLIEPDNIETCNKKQMFLYYDNSHYELIRFGDFNGTNRKKWNTIFNIEQNNYPPLHILLLIYGSVFSNINEQSQSHFMLFKKIMIEIHGSVKQNIKNQKFIEIFHRYFPGNQIQTKFNSSNKRGGEKTTDASPLLAYFITVNIYAKLGESLTTEQLKNATCDAKYNAIQKSFKDLVGEKHNTNGVNKTTQKIVKVGGYKYSRKQYTNDTKKHSRKKHRERAPKRTKRHK